MPEEDRRRWIVIGVIAALLALLSAFVVQRLGS